MTYEQLFVNPLGRTGRADFIRALIPLGAAAAFYHFLVNGGSGEYALLVLLFPALVLHARRLHDMGWSAWLLVIPAVPTAAAVWFHMYDRGQEIEAPIKWTALGVSGLFTLWGLFGNSAAARS